MDDVLPGVGNMPVTSLSFCNFNYPGWKEKTVPEPAQDAA